MDLLDGYLMFNECLFYVGFGTMLMLLAQILAATAIHPRLGVLINTLLKGLDGLLHFTVLFALVFVLFSALSCWAFAHDYDDFKDFPSAMTTQFKLFTGFELPAAIAAALQEPNRRNSLLIIHAVLSCVIELFLMSNFLVRV